VYLSISSWRTSVHGLAGLSSGQHLDSSVTKRLRGATRGLPKNRLRRKTDLGRVVKSVLAQVGKAPNIAIARWAAT